MKVIRNTFWIALFVKLIVAALLPLTSDESYYWVWAQYPQWSYYDHPPIVAWLYMLGDWVRWFPGSVRWPGVLLAHAGLYVWLIVLRSFLTDKQLLVWLWLMLLSPLVGGSAILVTPDLPLMFFYPVALWLYFKWLDEEEWHWAALLGLSIGLGFSSKYMMVLFVLSLLPLVLWKRPSRQLFVRHLPLLFVGFAVGTFPVWWWNIQNNFASIRFQTAHGLGRAWKPSWTFHYILAQIGLIFPLVLYWSLKGAAKVPRAFQFLAWIPLGFFFFTTFRGYVEANWPIASYPAIFALAASVYPRNRQSLAGVLIFWGTALVALTFIIIARPTWSRGLKFREFYQFDNVIVASRDLTPLYARSYQMAAKLHFELKRPVSKLKGMNRKDFYDFVAVSEPTEKSYYWVAEKTDVLPVLYKAKGHREVEVIAVDERYEIRRIEVP